MIHRQYVVKLAAGEGRTFPNLDIVVSLPGSYTAPVGVQASYPGGPVLTPAPAGWVGDPGWYYEVRSRAVRLESLAGSAAFTPRTRLGGYLAIALLVDGTSGVPIPTSEIPGVTLSASLAVKPISNALLGGEIGAFADPAYGPVVRLHNSAVLYQLSCSEADAAYFLVSLGIAENKDEDWAPLGHA